MRKKALHIRVVSLVLLSLLMGWPAAGLAGSPAVRPQAVPATVLAVEPAAPVGRNCGDVRRLNRLLHQAYGPQNLREISTADPISRMESGWPVLAEDLSSVANKSGLAARETHIWTTDADFLPGRFQQTELISGTGRITLARRWSSNVRVNDDTGDAPQERPSLAVGPNGVLYVAWTDARRGDPDICFCQSTDGGQNWSVNTRINDDPAGAIQTRPSLVVDFEGNLYVTWTDERNGDPDIFFARSNNGGLDWSANQQVNDQDSTPFSQDVSSLVVTSNGYLLAAWADKRNGDWDIFVAPSPDGGQVWGTNVRVNDDQDGRMQDEPTLGADLAGRFYLAWRDERNGLEVPDPDIYFARSADGGQTWSTNVRVNDDTRDRLQASPSLAVGRDGALFLAWRDDRNGASAPDPDIYFARSLDGGQTWSANIRVNNDADAALQDHPSLAVDDSDGLYLAWLDTRNTTAKQLDTDIYFAHSIDLGKSWMLQAPVNDDTVGAIQDWPSLAVDGAGNAFLTWQDGRRGNEDIFSARWPRRAFTSDGVYTAPVYDAVNLATWDKLSWTALVPPDTRLVVTARSGYSPSADIVWSKWFTFTTQPILLDVLPPGRYFQWRAVLSTAISTATPALEDVTIDYLACYDFSQTGRVSLPDVQTVAGRWGSVAGDADYLPIFDVVRDGKIDTLDLARVAEEWDQTCP